MYMYTYVYVLHCREVVKVKKGSPSLLPRLDAAAAFCTCGTPSLSELKRAASISSWRMT